MKQTIYIDVLISVNLFINYFLLLSVVKVLNLKLERKKLILSSLVGSLYSLIIFLPSINNILSLFIKLMMSATIVFIAFGFISLKMFLKIMGAFYAINFAFGGIVFFLWYFISPNGIFINNDMIYLNLSPIFLVITTFIAYMAIRLIDKLMGSRNLSELEYKLLIKNNNKTSIVKAKVDTGNTLKEPFSNIPVIVAQYECIENTMPEPLKEYFYKTVKSNESKDLYKEYRFEGFRMIPFKTISGEGLLPAFKPDYIQILSDSQNIKKEAYVAVCDKKIFNNEYDALINPEFIE